LKQESYTRDSNGNEILHRSPIANGILMSSVVPNTKRASGQTGMFILYTLRKQSWRIVILLDIRHPIQGTSLNGGKFNHSRSQFT